MKIMTATKYQSLMKERTGKTHIKTSARSTFDTIPASVIKQTGPKTKMTNYRNIRTLMEAA